MNLIEFYGALADWKEDPAAFDRILCLDGREFRSHKNRRTIRIEHEGRGYFVKIHRSAGWGEILKNILRLRVPVISAMNEVRAIRKLEELGVPTMRLAGYGLRGFAPAWLESFVITEELTGTVSLEDFTKDWKSEPPPPALKRTLIRTVADTARKLHESGVNHRDFYLCHFLLDQASLTGSGGILLSLIDLHRVQIRSRAPQRWIIKDLSGLFFSALDIGLTRRDLCRFLLHYRRKPLKNILETESRFWSVVQRRALRLYRKHQA